MVIIIDNHLNLEKGDIVIRIKRVFYNVFRIILSPFKYKKFLVCSIIKAFRGPILRKMFNIDRGTRTEAIGI